VLVFVIIVKRVTDKAEMVVVNVNAVESESSGQMVKDENEKTEI